MNCQLIADWGYGTQITSAAAFCGADRLGLAQVISRIGLVLGEGSDEHLVAAKQRWMEDVEWQPLRRLGEDMLLVLDRVEGYVAKLPVLAGLLNPLLPDTSHPAIHPPTRAHVSHMTPLLQPSR